LRSMLILMSFYFSFKCNVYHIDLLSFPTRRSSDLVLQVVKAQQLLAMPLLKTQLFSAFGLEITIFWGTQLQEVRELTKPEILTLDRKSTRLNSSHVKISYAVFCLKKKKQNNNEVVI